MTNKFLVKYATGLETETMSFLDSVEAFCNEHFGSTWGEAKANGASVVMVSEDKSEDDTEVHQDHAEDDKEPKSELPGISDELAPPSTPV